MAYARVEAGGEKATDILIKRSFIVPLLSLIVFAITLLHTTADPDLFARLAVGRLILSEGRLPLEDPFSFTADKPYWVDHEWLSGVVFFSAYSVGGDAALVVLKLFFIFTTIALLYRAHTANNDSPLIFSLGMVQCTSIWMSTIRSQVFTYLFLSYLLLALTRYERENRTKLLYVFPLVMLVWCNAHGGFVSGLGILGAYSLGKFFQEGWKQGPLVLTIVLSLAATAINPYGPYIYWDYILGAVFKDRPNIDEWNSASLLNGEALIPCLFLTLIAVGLTRRHTIDNLASLATLAISLLFGFRHFRLMPIFIMSCLTLGSQFLSNSRLSRLRVPTLITLLVSSLLAAGSILLSLTREDLLSLTLEPYPYEAMEWLSENRTKGRLLVDFNSGSYALWRLYPRFLVSLDGRYEELYSDKLVHVVAHALSDDPSRNESVSLLDPDFILLDKRMVSDHYYGDAWQKRYEDQSFVILERQDLQ